MVRFALLFDVKDRTVTFLGGRKYGVELLRAMGAGDLLTSMFDFTEKLTILGLSEEEMSLFTAVVLVSAGVDLRSPFFLFLFYLYSFHKSLWVTVIRFFLPILLKQKYKI